MTARTGYDLRDGAQVIRERIASAVGPCAGIERERHIDLIAEEVLRARRVSRISDHLQSRAAAMARQDRRRPLRVKGH
jgi:hypothetical protein